MNGTVDLASTKLILLGGERLLLDQMAARLIWGSEVMALESINIY